MGRGDGNGGLGRGPMDLRFLFGNQSLSVCCDVSGNRHLIADCRFLALLLSPVKEVSKKPAPSSEAGGTAQGACGPLKKPRGKKWVVRELPPAT